MLAVAMESLVKLLAFLAVGASSTFGHVRRHRRPPGRPGRPHRAAPILDRGAGWPAFLGVTMLSGLHHPAAAAAVPRDGGREPRRSRTSRGPRGCSRSISCSSTSSWCRSRWRRTCCCRAGVDRDMAVLALPLRHGQSIMALMAFIGGLSAATAMVIVESVALAIMISNDLVMPLVLRRRVGSGAGRRPQGDMGGLILGGAARRHPGWCCCWATSITGTWARRRWPPSASSPSRRSRRSRRPSSAGCSGGAATALGATAGIVAGLVVWASTLLHAQRGRSGWLRSLSALAVDWPVGLDVPGAPPARLRLRPAEITRGVAVEPRRSTSLAFIGLLAGRPPTPIERAAGQRLRVAGHAAPMAPGLPAVARHRDGRRAARDGRPLSRRRSGRRAPSRRSRAARHRWSATRDADIHLLRYAEHLLASAIGAASSRLVLSLLLRRRNVAEQGGAEAARRSLGGDPVQPRPAAARARPCPPGHHRVRPGPALTAWNREFQRAVRPAAAMLARVGVGLDEIVRFNAARGAYGPGEPDEFVADAAATASSTTLEPVRLRLHATGKVIEIRSARMPDGGIVTTYTDVTQTVEAEEALERANETLERRVRERTEELTRLNAELGARQGRGRRRQYLQDALPRRGQPRHPAAAQRRAALRDARWSSATAHARRAPTLAQQRRRLARGGRGDPRRAARHLAPRRRRDEAGDRRGSASTISCGSSSSSSSPLAREKGLELRLRRPARWRSARTGGCCAACCRTSSPTPSSTR